MSNDTHGQPKENKTIISFRNSFWLVIIIVALFVGALNFIQAMGSEEGKEGEGKAKTEMKEGNEGGTKAETQTEPKAEQPAPAADTTRKDTTTQAAH